MKMTRWGTVFAMLTLAGCATMDVHTDFDNRADFSFFNETGPIKTYLFYYRLLSQQENYLKTAIVILAVDTDIAEVAGIVNPFYVIADYIGEIILADLGFNLGHNYRGADSLIALDFD